jgi:transcriptional regulator with XRE-family HTH domain
LDSTGLQMDRVLSAGQVRAARGLLGWSRRELAIVSCVSEGTIKAIELGTTDARLSTLRKLARTFSTHAVEFVADGSRTGVTIRNGSDAMRGPKECNAQQVARGPARNSADEGTEEPRQVEALPGDRGPRWLRPLMRAARGQKG